MAVVVWGFLVCFWTQNEKTLSKVIYLTVFLKDVTGILLFGLLTWEHISLNPVPEFVLFVRFVSNAT